MATIGLCHPYKMDVCCRSHVEDDMRYWVSAVLLVFFLGTVSRSHENNKQGKAESDFYFGKGENLLHDCNDAVEFFNKDDIRGKAATASHCLGFISGVDDSLTYVELQGGTKVPYCKPSGVNVGQEARIANKYMNDHPEKLNLPGVTLVINALREAYPCENKK